jgi:hypothetical protein
LCHTGCSESRLACDTNIADQVLSPLIVVANVATLGASKSFQNGAKAVKLGFKVAYFTSRPGYFFLKFLRTIQSIEAAVSPALPRRATLARRTKLAGTTAQLKTVTETVKVPSIVYSARALYTTAFADDFVIQTSPEISDELERGLKENLKGDIEIAFIKAYWGEIQMGEVSNHPCVNHKTA